MVNKFKILVEVFTILISSQPGEIFLNIRILVAKRYVIAKILIDISSINYSLFIHFTKIFKMSQKSIIDGIRGIKKSGGIVQKSVFLEGFRHVNFEYGLRIGL